MSINVSGRGDVTRHGRPALVWLPAALTALSLCWTVLLARPTCAQPAAERYRSHQARFWAAGKIIPLDTPAVYSSRETYLPLQALRAVSASGTFSPSRGTVTIRLSNGQTDVLRAVPINGRPMIRLSELAESTNGVVIKPSPSPVYGLKANTAYLLARITDIHLDSSVLRIRTSFPVPFVSNTIEGRSSRGYVDCIGATERGFKPFILPADERRAERIRLAQFAPDIARIAIDFNRTYTLEPRNTRGKVTSKFVAEIRDERYAGNTRPDGDGSTGGGIPPVRTHRSDGGEDAPPPRPTPEPTRTAEIFSIRAEPIDKQSIQIIIETSRQAHASVRYISASRQIVIDIPRSRLNLDDEREKDHEIQHPLVEWLSAETVQSSPSGAPLTRITLDAPRFVSTRVETGRRQIILEIAVPESGRGNGGRTGGVKSGLVVVDAGHGGNSTGAKARLGSRRIYEKDVALAIASRLRAVLQARGNRVVMTRSKDVDVALEDRPRLANEVGADVFISIHTDSYGKGNTITGTTSYYHANSAASRRLAQCVERELAAVSGMRDRGAMSDTTMYPVGFCVLRETAMPAVLCEVGYLNNSKDRAKLTDAAFQRRVAEAMCNGIQNYVSGIQNAVRHRGKKQAPAA